MRLSNLKGITASEGSLWLVPQLTAFHQSKTKKSLAVYSCSTPLDDTFVVYITYNKNVGYVVNYTLFEACGWLKAANCLTIVRFKGR